MKKGTRVLDSISGYLFLTGFITAKLKNIPVALVSAIFDITSLFAYLFGYLVWYVSALLYPDHPRRRDSWYGFAQFKEQYQIAALLGTIATIATIISLIFPPLLIPTAWLYTISNFIWSASEYHKQQNTPPGFEGYSTVKQGIYLRYTILVTASSVIAAIAITIAISCPPTAFIIVPIASIIGILLSLTSLYYWGKAAFGNYPPDKTTHSYSKLSDQLSFTLGAVDNSSSEALPPATCSRDPEILLNAQHYCTKIDRSGSREQVAGRRHLNCQQTLDNSPKPENEYIQQKTIGSVDISCCIAKYVPTYRALPPLFSTEINREVLLNDLATNMVL